MEIFLFWMGCAIAAGIVGAAKGRSGFAWFLLGLLFSVFALVVVACLPSNKAVVVVQSGPVPTPDTHVKCPDCKELVLKDARVCKHCRCKLVPQLA